MDPTRRSVSVLVALALFGSAVAASTAARVDAATPTARHVGTTSTGGFWTRCGSIYCGSLTVPLARPARSGPSPGPGAAGRTITLPVYGRPSREGFGSKLLVLIADRDTNQSPRLMVERAPLTLGLASTDYTVVSLAVRGSTVAPVPRGAHATASAFDAVDDLRALLAALGVARVRVIGWGNGATIAATWMMTQPGTVAAAVLDSPVDPSRSMVAQGTERRDAMNQGVEALMRWCASHLSCPLNQETRLTWRRLMARLADGDAPAALTNGLIGHAGHAALHSGQFALFFRGLESAFKGDLEGLRALAAAVPAPETALWRCADLRVGAARAMAKAWADTEEVRWRWFVPGDHGALYRSCASSTVATVGRSRPLGTVKPVRSATGARVYVTVARFDPTMFLEGPRALAKKMKWKYRSVPASRHLVVGHDRAITARVMEFLSG